MGTFFRNAILVQLDPPLVQQGNLRQEAGKIVSIGPDVTEQAGDETHLITTVIVRRKRVRFLTISSRRE